MASEQRLYTFSPETKAFLRKFRLSTSRAKDPQAVICEIDKKTLEIKRENDDVIYKSLVDISDALPDNSPRFVLLSYPLTLASGRQTAPYVMLSYMPSTCPTESRMLYAGAKELLRREAETGQIIEVQDAEEVEEVKETLMGKDQA